MRTPTFLRPLAAATLAALLLVACGGDTGDVAELRDDLEIQAQAQAGLRERIRELETSLDSGDDEGQAATQRLSGLEEQLKQLTDELGATRLELEAQRTAAEDRTAAVDASLSSLDARIEELGGRIASLEQLIQQVRNDVLSLTDEHELLRAEFDDHKRSHD